MKLFMGNPCGFGNCKSGCCEKCYHWHPCIYYGKSYKEFRLPKWKWLVNTLYRIEEKLL